VVSGGQLHDVMMQCQEHNSVWKAVVEANNQHPINFKWKGNSGYLAPVLDDVYALKTGQKKSPPRKPSPQRESIRAPPKPDKDAAIAKAARASAKARAKKKSKSRTQRTQKVDYVGCIPRREFSEEPDSDSQGSYCASVSESESESSSESESETEDDAGLSDGAQLWLQRALETVSRSGIVRLMDDIGVNNGERVLKAYQDSGLPLEELFGTENLIHIAEVAKTNHIAVKTPGMVSSLIKVTSSPKVPKSVAQLARRLFVEAAQDVINLFMRKLGPDAICPHDKMDERARMLHRRVMYNEPSNTPFTDLVIQTKGIIKTRQTMAAIKTYIESVIHKRLTAYKYLFMVVYVYGLTLGFVLVPSAGIQEGLYNPSSKL